MLAMGKSGLAGRGCRAACSLCADGREPDVRYAITPGKLQRLVFSLIPKRMQDRALAKRLGLTRQRA